MVLIQVNAKEQNLLYNAISVEEYEKISSCNTAKEMWGKLEVTYEETSKVKETRINLLVHDYELLQMKEGESIEETFARFIKIIGDLKAFGKPYSSGDQVRKILRRPENDIDDDPEALEEEIAMVSRNMNGLMRRYRNIKKGRMSSRQTRKYNEQDKIDGKCYECGRYGHVQTEFPDLKRKVSIGFNKNKSFESWSNEDNLEHEEIANMCFMTVLENDIKYSNCWTDENTSDNEAKQTLKTVSWHKVKQARDVLQDEVQELQMQLNDMRKSTSHSSVKSNQATYKSTGKRLDGFGNPKTTLIPVDLTSKDPRKLGYLKEGDNSILQEYHRKSRKGKWYLDSVYSIHMTVDENLFKEVTKINVGSVKFGDDSKGKIVGTDTFPFNNNCDITECTKPNSRKHDVPLKMSQIKQYFQGKAPRSPQRNGVVERKNLTLQDIAGTMILEHSFPNHFLAEAVGTTCHILNRCFIRPILKKIPYELWKRKRPNIGYYHPFGNKCFIHNNGKDNLGKFDPRSDEGIKTRGAFKKKANIALISQIELKKVEKALKDSSWVQAIQDELDQFDKNQAWELLPKPANAAIVGTKWVFRNKLNGDGKMDVKSAFLNGFIDEEVYVKQPPGFEDSQFPYHVGKVDTTLFIKRSPGGNLIIQVYVDDIIFGSANSLLCKEFANLMQSEFEMSMMEELTFFLGLQIQQSEEGTLICQPKYTKEFIQKFGMSSAKAIDTPMSPSINHDKDEKGNPVDETKYRGMIGSLLYLIASRPNIMFSVCKCVRFKSFPKESHLTTVKRIIRYLIGIVSYGPWYPRSNNFKLEGFLDADLAGDKEDMKRTSGTCQLLGKSLISWNSKKQGSVTLSTTEADAICLSKNHVHHSRAKHIDIKHHFIRDHVIKGDIELSFVSTIDQLADIFVKPLLEVKKHEEEIKNVQPDSKVKASGSHHSISDPDIVEILTIGDIYAISKETGFDVSKIRVKILKLAENVVKTFKEVHDMIDEVSISANASFDRVKKAICNTLTNFLRR
ncbi:uncharacterized protein LOC142164131 [Nicotiana tabacum]|uniref:Uncharacterized protein LOC142164131 n=1 Tax=Nicotiana tabacum TaxID=4097 RepID=A0AC58RXH1_TOBAC